MGVVLTGVKACILRTMDALNIKGLQHLLVNVVVLLDLNLNFQTTNEFVPEREIADVARGNERQ